MSLIAVPNPILVASGATTGSTTLQWAFPGQSVAIYVAVAGAATGAPVLIGGQIGSLAVSVTDGAQFIATNPATGTVLGPAITISLINKAALPTLNSGFMAYYSSSEAIRFNTGVVAFMSDEEQRWVRRKGLAEFQLVYTDVDSYDLNTMLEFFLFKKGKSADVSLTNCFTVTWDGNTYDWCLFNQDSLEETEDSCPNRYSFTLDIVQVRT